MEETTNPNQNPNSAGNPSPDQTPEPTNAAADSSTHQPKKSRRKLLLIVLALAAILAAAGGYLWWNSNKDNNQQTNQPTTTTPVTTTQTPEPTATTCPNQVSFSNKSFGASFCYPVAWGDYTVENDKLAASDTGTRLIVNFSKKPSVHVAGASTNWTTTVGRDGICSDPPPPATEFGPLSTEWETEGSGMDVTSATRRIVNKTGTYLIDEYTDDVLTNGVCLKGYSIINGSPFNVVTASYFAAFGKGITTPKAHIDNPNILIPAADRADFKAVVLSVKKL